MTSKQSLFIFGSLALLMLGACTPNKSSSEQSSMDEAASLSLESVSKENCAYSSTIDGLKDYKKTDWKAYWIWLDSFEQNSYAGFRKSFTLKEKPTSAIAHIAVESKYYLWVNGVLAVTDGGGRRGPTSYDSFYEDVDLASYLVSGENEISILATYWGKNSNCSIDPGAPGFLFEMMAGDTLVKSDSSWKASRLKEYRNEHLLRGEGPSLNIGIFYSDWDTYYDARIPNGDFRLPSYDDAAWNKATVVGKVGYAPFGDTYKNSAPVMAFDKNYTNLENATIGKALSESTKIALDLGGNKQFSPYFELSGATEGSLITFYTDSYDIAGDKNFKDYYVCKAGEQTYELYPWRSGSQLIIEAPAGVTFKKIGYRESSYPSESIGSFLSEDSALNTLWEKAQRTLKICMRDTYMDCPDRERSPYTGDSANQMGEAPYALDTISNGLSKKAILTSLGWIGKDHVILTRSPSTSSSREIPVQNLAFIANLYSYLLSTGDKESVAAYYPAALEYLKLFKSESNGLIAVRTTENAGSKVWSWFDWGNGSDEAVLTNCWYYYTADCLGKIAAKLSLSDGTSFLEEKKTAIKTAFDGAYLTAGGYSSKSDHIDERANAMAVVSGLASESSKASVRSILNSVKTASPYMEKYAEEALCLLGHPEEAAARMKDRYGAMISDSSTTLWELFQKEKGTLNHGWSGGSLTVLSRYFEGLVPTDTGYAAYTLSPIASLSKLDAVTDTVKGKLSFSLSKEGAKRTLKLSCPDSQGTLLLPNAWGSSVSVSGGSATSNGTVGDCVSYSLSKGEYTFLIQ